MPQNPTAAWLAQYEKVKDRLTPSVPYGEIFGQSEAYGQKLHYLAMGEVNFPTGKIMAFDPVAYPEQMRPYLQSVPPGKYPITAMVVEIGADHYRIAAVRVQTSGRSAIAYYNALTGQEDLSEVAQGEYFGFCVDAGLGTIMDEATFAAYTAFTEKCLAEDEYFNLYDDLFAEELEKNYQAHPAYQNEDGDWVNYRLPDSELTVPVFSAGWGDGVYPVYFGYDGNGEVCDVIIEFIPIDELDDEDDDDDE